MQIPDKSFDACSEVRGKIDEINIEQNNPRELKVTKVIYDYKSKTVKQIKELIQLEIDTWLSHWPDYKFVNSKSYFNDTSGIDLQLNFELK